MAPARTNKFLPRHSDTQPVASVLGGTSPASVPGPPAPLKGGSHPGLAPPFCQVVLFLSFFLLSHLSPGLRMTRQEEIIGIRHAANIHSPSTQAKTRGLVSSSSPTAYVDEGIYADACIPLRMLMKASMPMHVLTTRRYMPRYYIIDTIL